MPRSHAELLSEGFLQTGAVEGSERGELLGLQTAVDKSGKGGDVSGVEDDDDVLHVRAILMDEIAELSSNLAVALEKVFAGHTLLTGCTA